MKAFRAAALTGAGLAGYALSEPYRFRLRTHSVPSASPVAPLSVLHVSDLHMGDPARLRFRLMKRFLADVAQRCGEVDIVAATGDLIEDDRGIAGAVEALAGFPARLGRFFVLGSHDYFQSRFAAYTKYFTGQRPVKAPPADTEALTGGLKGAGWIDLTNTVTTVDTGAGTIRVAGIDDPYLHRHRTEHIARGGDDAFALGLVHAPDVVSEWLLAGFDLVLAGHTHAGQVRFPFAGAAVTNSTLPATLAGGLHRIGSGWLHVSPGMGNGRYAPIRFLARPEVTLLRVVPDAS